MIYEEHICPGDKGETRMIYYDLLFRCCFTFVLGYLIAVVTKKK